MSKFLVACDDGHGMETPGKRTPPLKDDIKFRGKVCKKGSCIYENEFNKNIIEKFIEGCKRCGIDTLPVASGDTDIPLATRVGKANSNCAENTLKGVCKALDVKYKEDFDNTSKPNKPIVDDKDIVYRVIARSYLSKDNANKLVQELKRKGYDAFLTSHSI